ncbi:alpha-L-rhamnosidase N-terminal domain-containing protein [Chitinophaga horti]|uniref:Alpha-L-rhamnosidase N-terminal domain-containing protein n=1 Tax=Chitinophaga horti TaxID=2920382 RepID=A0ABY6IX47_9BACT|nr:alpha-L-rhamnosidase N-terminal domain-containing protein [Chitinophaga horti]UYQ91954.1 alpha-L-rhamnosidase N-terminal domain-containing protein [Chitinophaga horti]
MKRLFLIALLVTASAAAQVRAANPVNLKCEYLVNPIGLDAKQPRFTWQMNDKRPGAAQSAYQLFVYSDAQGKQLVWQTDKINGQDILATYQGKPLSPFSKYWWKVQLWDHAGKSSQSPLASFETGMMGDAWQGKWITDTDDKDLKPAAYFRKTFPAARKIASARAYIAVAGLYELYINGEKIGNHRLDPMYTRFDRRNLYVTYDVTKQLQSGTNAIGVLLGNGWYNHQSTAVWDFHNAPWRARPAFCLDLRITYSDGSQEVIKSNDDWKTALSPVIFNSIYTAEHYDARLELPGWNTHLVSTMHNGSR